MVPHLVVMVIDLEAPELVPNVYGAKENGMGGLVRTYKVRNHVPSHLTLNYKIEIKV